MSCAQWVETCPYNEVERREGRRGRRLRRRGLPARGRGAARTRASSSSGCTWPLPAAALRDFADSVEAVYVVEEGSEYLKDAVRACGVPVSETPCPLPRAGELSPGLVRAAFGLEQPPHAPAATDLPGRPPALCPGCPHRLVFKELSRMRAIVTGDIGCYTLGALPPLSAMDTTRGHGGLGLHGPRLRAGAGRHGASSHRRRHRGLHVRPFGPKLAHLHGVQPRRRHGVRARQPHHRHDGAPGQPLQRRDPAEPARAAS